MHPDLAQNLLRQQKTAYVLLDAALQVRDYGGYTPAFMEGDSEAPELLDLVPELIGCEEVLEEVRNGAASDFHLENINRVLPDGELAYLSLRAAQHQTDEEAPLLLISLVDETRQSQVEQTLTQQRNELRLLQQSLDDTNKQLEFILQRYVPKEVGRALMENRLLPDLGGEEREVTVMFVDLRNYTSTSENMSPKETIDMLHVFLDIACRAIVDAGGVVVNYMGDAVMALFNAPDLQADHACRAARAGLAMQAAARELAERRDEHRFPPLFFGVGINSGPTLVGNLGALHYYQYTAIGDTTNVASRLCGHARAGEVLIGEAAYALLGERISARPLQAMLFKGKSKEIQVYQVMSLQE